MNNNVKELTFDEMLVINGGHDGVFYELGRGTAKAIKFFAAVVAFLAFKK